MTAMGLNKFACFGKITNLYYTLSFTVWFIAQKFWGFIV